MDFLGKKVLIIGYSITGIAAAKCLTKLGAKCFISEFDGNKKTDDIPLGVKAEFGSHSEEFINGADIAITSPGINPNAPIFKTLDDKGIEYISDIELAYRMNKTKMISITGTNGKTTTTMLLAHILGVNPCGNIGISPCDYILDEPNWLVCETSSFQAHYSPTFAPEIAIFSNLTPDHIYFHGSIENYFNDKAKIFRNMKKGSAILNLDDEMVSSLKLDCDTYYFSTKKEADGYIKDNALYFKDKKIIDIKDVPIVGEHNLQNVLSVVIASIVAGVSIETIREKIKTFVAPEHRCEFVCSADEIDFYNDSKATNPEASIVALKAFEGRKVSLIAGGRDKGTTLEEFCEVVKDRIDSVVLIGEATERFDAELKKAGYENIKYAKELDEAIDVCISTKPDVVLLSPACASFDMFKSFEHRGDEFKKYAKSKIKIS